jgi:hypothetical protein
VAFEKESDAIKLAQSVGAQIVDQHRGYASHRAFKFGPDLVKKLNAAVR